MIADLFRELLQATVAGAAAVLVIALLRKPLRKLIGPESAYRVWLLVPAAVLAVWLPAPTLAPVAMTVSTGGAVGALSVVGAAPPSEMDWMPLALGVWLFGVMASVAWFAVRQRRFNQRIQRQPDQPFDLADGAGPAVVGGWRARIVLPMDFRDRYSDEEQRLILAHEFQHVRRGDLQAQALATALRGMFWFNPLIHVGASLFRFDQELACDAAVLKQFPQERRRYADTMLKTQLAQFGLPLACHWQFSHSLKERISMLKQPLPTPMRRLAGALLTLGLLAGGSYSAWAVQPGVANAASAAPLVDVSMKVSIDGGTPSAPRVIARLGEPFAVAVGEGASAWRVELTARDEANNEYGVEGAITRGERIISQPRIRVASGKPLTIDVTTPEGDARLTLVMTISPSQAAVADAVPLPSAMGIVSKIGDGDHLSPPTYPPEAKAKGITGNVLLALKVGVDGSMKEVRVISAEPKGVFEQASLDAARSWKLHPAMKDGKPIESWVKIPVKFLPNDPDQPTKQATAPSDAKNILASGEAPKYPADALAEKISGKVVLEVSYAPDGHVTAVDVVTSELPQKFDDAAVAAAWKWKFNPATKNGEHVGGRIRVPVTFEATDPPVATPAKANS